MGILNDLTIKYDVDALELGYTQHYNQLLSEVRDDFTKVLEIGVETGRSHRLWLEYFPNAKIYGYDIFKYGYDELQRLQEANPFLDRSVMFKGDQSNVEDLNRFKSEHGGDFDMIIDDGGHTMEQMQTSLNHLWDSVKPGGIYAVVDHTARHMEEQTPSNRRRIDPVLAIKEIQEAGFEFVDYTDLHYRADDELRYEVGVKSVSGNTDRWTIKFRKPK